MTSTSFSSESTCLSSSYSCRRPCETMKRSRSMTSSPSQSIGGRCWAHGRARSKAAEARSTVASSNRRPTIFSLISAASSVADSQQSLASAICEPPSVEVPDHPVRLVPQASAAAEARIERVAQRVAEQVRAEDREADRDTREEHEVRRFLGVLGGRDGQHAAPRRVRLRDAASKERQRRLDEDRAPELSRAEDDERPHRVGQD